MSNRAKLFTLTILGSLLLFCFLFFQSEEVEPCSSVEIYLWKGVTSQDDSKFELYNLKFKNVTSACRTDLGAFLKVSLPTSNLEFHLDFTPSQTSYELFSYGVSIRPSRHLELFLDENMTNFTLAFAKKEIDVNLGDAPLPVLLISNNRQIQRFKDVKRFRSLSDMAILPKISYKLDKNQIEACSEADRSFMESIRIDFELKKGGQDKHYQKVCVFDTSSPIDATKFCCHEKLPEGIRKIGLIRWRGDESSLYFAESLITIFSKETD